MTLAVFAATLAATVHLLGPTRDDTGSLGPVPPIARVEPPVAAAVEPPRPLGPAAAGGWSRIAFRDEFDSGSGQWERNWRMGDDTSISPPANRSLEAACWDPRNTTVADGHLVLRAEAAPCIDDFGRHHDHTGAGASTGRFTFTYGYVEARISLPTSGPGHVANFPAFWLNGARNDDAWPEGGEIDVVEVLDAGVPCWYVHSARTAGRPPLGSCPTDDDVPSLADPSGWHTYGVEWAPDRLRFFFDGVAVGTLTTDVPLGPMYLVVDHAVPSRWAKTLPAEMRVDYVRVWQH